MGIPVLTLKKENGIGKNQYGLSEKEAQKRYENMGLIYCKRKENFSLKNFYRTV